MVKNNIAKKQDSYRSAVAVVQAFRGFVKEFNRGQAAGDVDIGDMVGAAMLAFMEQSHDEQVQYIRLASGKAGATELERFIDRVRESSGEKGSSDAAAADSAARQQSDKRNPRRA